MNKKISGIVIGSRKAGTTWLYENFRIDDRICVSESVKESGFFSGRIGTDGAIYEQLFPLCDYGAVRVEVDTSVCYAIDAPESIRNYNPDMRIVLIFRSPVEFLVSRFTHGKRKGEFNADNPADAFLESAELRRELDYVGIHSRFLELYDQNKFKVFIYDDLVADPIAFYANVVKSLGVNGDSQYVPFLNPVNVARNAKNPKISSFLSNSAILARKYGFHRTVNYLKSLGILNILETIRPTVEVENYVSNARDILISRCPETLSFYSQLKSEKL